MKINHDLRHKISVVEAQGKALIEQKVELEAGAQAQGQEVGALRQEVVRLRERLQGEPPARGAEEAPQPPSPAEVNPYEFSYQTTNNNATLHISCREPAALLVRMIYFWRFFFTVFYSISAVKLLRLLQCCWAPRAGRSDRTPLS